jgi:PAS domain S-box-containing protein
MVNPIYPYLILNLVEEDRMPKKKASRPQKRVQNEKKPKKNNSNGFLESVLNAITDGITVIDRDLSVSYINQSLAHFYGFETTDEVVGKKCYNAYRRQKKRCVHCPTKEIFDTGKPHHTILSSMDSHDNEIYWDIYFYPLYDDNGKVKSVVEYSKNITREKMLEARVETTERKLADILSTSRDVVVEYDSNMEPTYISDNIKDLSGYSVNEILKAHNFLKFIPPETQKMIEKNFKARMMGKKVPRLYESEILHANGSRIPVEIQVAEAKEEGKITGGVATIRDITERKDAEKSLRESEKRYRMLFKKSPTSITVLDIGGKILDCNKSTETMTGFSKKEIVGRTFDKILAIRPQDLSMVTKRFSKLVKGNFVKPYDLEIIRKDKTRRWVHIASSPIKIENKIIGVQVIARDITEQKEAQQQILMANERLQYLLSATSAVIYTAKPSGDYGALFISDNINQMVGYKGKSFLEDSNFWTNHIHPDDKKRIFKEIKNLFKKGRYSIEYRFKHKKGHYIWVRDEMKLVKDKKGKATEIVGFWIDITERKKAEEALRESEELYRTLVETSPDGIVLTDMDTNIIMVNQSAYETLGYKKAEDVLGKSSFDLMAPEDQHRIFENVEELLETGRVKNVEFNFIHRNGTRIPIEFNASLVYDEKGEPKAFFGISRNVTERKEAEMVIKESQEKYSNLFHQSNDAIIIHDLKGGMMDVNQKAVDLFGYTKKILLSKKVPELHPKDELKKSKKAFKRISKEGKISFEITFQKKNGDVFPAEVSSNLFEIGDKKFIQGIIRDITERKRAEEALKESEEMYRSLIETSPDAITVTDLEGKISFVSQRAVELAGYKKPIEVIGKNAFDFIDLKDQELALKNLRKTLKSGSLRNTEYIMKKKDGSRYTGELNAAIIKDARGNPKAFLGITRDVTERKQAEEALRYRLEFEEIITTFSSHLINLKTDEIDEGIDIALEKIGKFTKVDRCMVYLLHEDGSKMSKTYEWTARGIKSQKKAMQNLDVDNFEWGINRLKKLFPLDIPRVGTLPKEAASEKRMLKSMGIKSFLSVPIVIGGAIYGFVGFQTVKEQRIWSDDTISILQVVAEIFGNALERKRAEEAIAESEEKFRSLAEKSPNMIFINKSGSIVYANEASQEVMGYKRGELYHPDFNFMNLISPESSKSVKTSFEKHMKGQDVPPYECALLTNDGAKIDSIIATKLISYEGESAILGIVTDITERKKAEEKIKELKDFSESIIKSMAEGVMILDVDGLITFVNPKIEDILGYKRSQLVGTHWENILASDYHKQMRDCYSINFGGEQDRFEAVLVKKNKTELPVLISASPQMKDDEFSGILAVITDISARKREEIAREELMTYKIRRGSTYLIEETEIDRAKDVVYELYKNHFSGIIITREHPEKMKNEINLNLPIYWMTNDPKDRSSIRPEFSLLEKIIDDEIDRNTFVFLDRFDYIVTQNNFKEALNFIQHLNEMFYTRKAILIVSLDPDTLTMQELSLLEKETSVIERKHLEKLSDDLMDLLAFVNKHNRVGDSPSYNQVGEEFKISRTTARKRIRELVDGGFLSEKKSGRFKYLVLTEKGKEML